MLSSLHGNLTSEIDFRSLTLLWNYKLLELLWQWEIVKMIPILRCRSNSCSSERRSLDCWRCCVDLFPSTLGFMLIYLYSSWPGVNFYNDDFLSAVMWWLLRPHFHISELPLIVKGWRIISQCSHSRPANIQVLCWRTLNRIRGA